MDRDSSGVDSATAQVANRQAGLGFACVLATPLLAVMAEQDWLDGHVSGIATIGYCLTFLGGLTLCTAAGRRWGNMSIRGRVLTAAGITLISLFGITALVGMYSWVTSFG